jgi:hypothetical protein
MTKCAFSKGSSTDTGQHAPEKCKRAIFEQYKRIIEQCEIDHPALCPLRAFVSKDNIHGVISDEYRKDTD